MDRSLRAGAAVLRRTCARASTSAWTRAWVPRASTPAAAVADAASAAASAGNPIFAPIRWGFAASHARGVHGSAARFVDERFTPVLETPEKAHFAIAPELRGSGDPVPLHAIVFLAIHDGPMALEEVGRANALRDLWAMSFYLPDDAGRARCFELLGQLVAGVPAYRLSRRLDPENLAGTLDLLTSRFGT